MVRMVWLVMACVVLGGCRDSNSPVGTWKPSPPDKLTTMTLVIKRDQSFALLATSMARGTQSSGTLKGQWERKGDRVLLHLDLAGSPKSGDPGYVPHMELLLANGELVWDADGAASKEVVVFVRS